MNEGLVNHSRSIRILLTGFGPFRTHKQNASFEIIRDLPRKIRDEKQEIELIIHPEPVEVSYSSVGKVMMNIYSNHEELDFVIHLGVSARLERAQFAIEKQAHRTGYTSTDINGFIGDQVLQNPEWNHWNSAPLSLHTSIDVEQLIDRVKQEKLSRSISITASEDAGRYLCEFIYYNSLLHYYMQPEGLKLNELDKTLLNLPVIFLHVPAFVENSEVELGRNVVELILKNLKNLC